MDDREISSWERWIDPELFTASESTPREVERHRAELRARRDAAFAKYGDEPASPFRGKPMPYPDAITRKVQQALLAATQQIEQRFVHALMAWDKAYEQGEWVNDESADLHEALNIMLAGPTLDVRTDH